MISGWLRRHKPRPGPWVVCVAASLFFLYELLQGDMFASLHDELVHAFGLSSIGAGYLSSVFYVANVLVLFPAGVILDRYAIKPTVLFTLSLSVVALVIFSVTTSFYTALVCRFLTGVGSGFCFLSCFRLVSLWFPLQRLAMVTAVMVTIAMIGGVLAQGPLTQVVLHYGWRHALLLDAGLGVVIGLIIGCYVREPVRHRHSVPRSEPEDLTMLARLHLVYANRQNLLAGLYTSMMNMPVVLLGAYMGSVYLVGVYHWPRQQAAAVNGMIFIGMIVGGPLIGYWSDSLKQRKQWMIVFNLLAMMVAVMMLCGIDFKVSEMKGLFFILGLCCSAQVLSYPLVAASNPRALTATAVSVVSALTQGGFILYQNLFSILLSWFSASSLSHAMALQRAMLMLPCGFAIALVAACGLIDGEAEHAEVCHGRT